jgi:hypothetical protein
MRDGKRREQRKDEIKGNQQREKEIVIMKIGINEQGTTITQEMLSDILH